MSRCRRTRNFFWGEHVIAKLLLDELPLWTELTAHICVFTRSSGSLTHRRTQCFEDETAAERADEMMDDMGNEIFYLQNEMANDIFYLQNEIANEMFY